MVATCLSTAFATFLMAFLPTILSRRRPRWEIFFCLHRGPHPSLHLATGIRRHFYFRALVYCFIVCGASRAPGNLIPTTLKSGIAAGIGLLIAVVGLEWAGIVVKNPGTLVSMGKLSSPPVLLSLLGLTVMAILLALGARSAILAGILATLTVGLMTGMVNYQGIIGPVPSLQPTLFKLDIVRALKPACSP